MDRLHFEVEETPRTPLADRQAVPYVNGERLTELLGAVPPQAKRDEPYEQYPENNIGMEPETAFLPSRHYFEPTEGGSLVSGKTVLLRCSCGDWKCTQVIAEVRVEDAEVVWAGIERIPALIGTGERRRALRPGSRPPLRPSGVRERLARAGRAALT
jgi:hypothetical protein